MHLAIHFVGTKVRFKVRYVDVWLDRLFRGLGRERQEDSLPPHVLVQHQLKQKSLRSQWDTPACGQQWVVVYWGEGRQKTVELVSSLSEVQTRATAHQFTLNLAQLLGACRQSFQPSISFNLTLTAHVKYIEWHRKMETRWIIQSSKRCWNQWPAGSLWPSDSMTKEPRLGIVS